MRLRARTAGALLRAVALLGLGVWGVLEIAAGDWFFGGVLVACMLLGAQSLLSTLRRA